MKLWSPLPRKVKTEHEFLESVFYNAEVTTDGACFQIVIYNNAKDRRAIDELEMVFGYRMVYDPVHYFDGVDVYWVRKRNE